MQLLATRADRDAVAVVPPRAKNNPAGMFSGAHLICLPLDDAADAHTSAARCAVVNELYVPVAAAARAVTPFLAGSHTGCVAMAPW